MKSWPAVLGAVLAVALALFMIVEPAATLEASANGLKLWFQAVLPALFPFFVVCDLLVALGVVRFLGVILEPVMRPVFRLPGAAGFVVAMGFTSGFPRCFPASFMSRVHYQTTKPSGWPASPITPARFLSSGWWEPVC